MVLVDAVVHRRYRLDLAAESSEAPKTVENKGSGQTKKRKEQEPSRRTSIKP